MGTPVPAWTVPAWTRCGTPPKRVCSTPSGACRRTGWPAPTPTRSWSLTSWPGSGSRCVSPMPRTSPPTTRKQCCSPRCKASSRSTRKPRSPNATAAANCSAPAPAKSPPGKPPTATAGSLAAVPSQHTWRSTSQKPRWCDASSPTGPPAQRSEKSAEPSTPTGSRRRPGKRPGDTPRSLGCCTTKPMWAGSTSTAPKRCPTAGPPDAAAQVPRDRADWIPIDCPLIVTDDVFETAGRVAVDNTRWSPLRAEPGQWLLKGLIKCGACGVGTNCHKMRGRNGTWHRYYYCSNHDPLRAGGQEHRCPERNIRADALDDFVFDQIKRALLQPDLLLTGEHSVALTAPVPDDELLATELARLNRKVEAADAEKRRLVDLYQAGLIELAELQRRAADVAARHRELRATQTSLAEQRTALARGNQVHRRVHDFADRIRGVIDHLDPIQKQQLLRLLIEEVRVTKWHVEIRLRIALDQPPPDLPDPNRSRDPQGPPSHPRLLSSENGLRSIGGHRRRQLPHETSPRQRRNQDQQPLRNTRRLGTFTWPPAGTTNWPLTSCGFEKPIQIDRASLESRREPARSRYPQLRSWPIRARSSAESEGV